MNIPALIGFCLRVFLFFFIDVCLFSITSYPISYLVLYTGLREIVTSAGMGRVYLVSFLLFLETFLYGSQLELAGAVSLTLVAGAFYIRKAFYPDRFLFVSLSMGCFVAQIALVEGFFMGMPLFNYYTFVKIAVNLILIALFSLKLRFQGSRDNRYKQ